MIKLYLIIINTLTFLLMGIDKLKAIFKKYRINENLLIFLSLIGGSIGTFIGMIIFHHKVRKKKFYILIPILLILTIYIITK